MSKLFNYGSPVGNNGGWSEKGNFFEEKEIDSDFSSSVTPRENPRVAVPSPFARFQIIKEAFENISGNLVGRKSDSRDVLLVSQVLDIFEFIYEGGIQKNELEITTINLTEITGYLEDSDNDGTRLLGRTLRDYSNRERYGLNENNVFYAIHRNGEPLAITSPTSGWLPTPNYGEWSYLNINGSIPLFSVKRGLIERNEEFVLCLYSWITELVAKNGSLPDALENFGKYLSTQEDNAPHELREKIRNAKKSGNYSRYKFAKFRNIEPKIWETPFYAISGDAASNMIADQSDLRIASSVNGASHPLVLTTNCVYSNLIYTSGNTLWDSRNPGFSYADKDIKSRPIWERNVLPNGQGYSDGFIYEHDFLADTIIQLPYKFNADMYFDGNIDGLKSDEIGFIPPIKEEYFNYFTAADVRKNLRMVVHCGNGGTAQVERVEVFLDIPTTHGKKIELKKTYHMATDFQCAVDNVESADGEATGYIAPNCGVALNTLPFVRAHAENYYAFQLLVDDFGLDDYCVWLNVCNETEVESTHDITNGFSRYVRRTSKANKTPIITSYTLNGGNFDYLKLSFGKKLDELKISALIIPKKAIPQYIPQAGRSLEFCFDFGTSNTFVAVRDDEGKFIDFKLPTDDEWLVSTMHPKTGNVNDNTVISFTEYGRQEFLPIFGSNRAPFPVSTVLSAPKFPDEAPILYAEEDECNPMLAGSIPFVYGAEDFGNQFNRIITNLKWAKKRKASEADYTACFINELMFLAQVFAMTQGAELTRCSVFWTYPLSMDKVTLNSLSQKWKNAFSRFFEGDFRAEKDSNDSGQTRVRSFPESMAPMLYLLNRFKLKSETTLSVDIGGGTCDLVIVPDGKIRKLRATSIGFGADCIFGIKGRKASEVSLFRLAIKHITQTLRRKAAAKDPDAEVFNAKADELQKMLDEGRYPAEMSTYLFNLPNNPHLKKISNEISFNQWIQNHEYHHTVFIYYYAALMYYITELWKSFKDIEKPGKIFFSGGGSKILDIVCGGERALLDEYTDELFNLFAADVLDEEQLEESISVKREVNEPKQITAKGVLVDISANSALSEIKDRMLNWTKASDRKEYQEDFKMLGKKDVHSITYGDLTEDETVELVMDKIKDFHEKLLKFLSMHDEFTENVSDMERDFTNRFSSERKLRKAVRSYLESLMDENGADPSSEYTDVPFIEIVRNLIVEAMAPESDIL